ncbi:zinc finger protein 2-like [Mya arenaria]|uniref:zinc finger protein 2-like n=1 Tax=Mya arenaria TaxID=6604 RepID=UPI0022E52615|nr:zinc finger protein 2-like [Mya arenaria]
MSSDIPLDNCVNSCQSYNGLDNSRTPSEKNEVQNDFQPDIVIKTECPDETYTYLFDGSDYKESDSTLNGNEEMKMESEDSMAHTVSLNMDNHWQNNVKANSNELVGSEFNDILKNRVAQNWTCGSNSTTDQSPAQTSSLNKVNPAVKKRKPSAKNDERKSTNIEKKLSVNVKKKRIRNRNKLSDPEKVSKRAEYQKMNEDVVKRFAKRTFIQSNGVETTEVDRKGSDEPTNNGQGKINLQDITYECSECDYVGGRHNFLEHCKRSHCKDIEEYKMFKCETCSKSFVLKKDLTKHIRVHHSVVVNCEVCGKSFNNAYYLTKHSEIHKEIRNEHECKVCHKIFLHQSALVTHIRRRHPDQKDNLIRFRSSLNYKDQTPIVCDCCGKEFDDRDKFSRHVYNHSKQRPVPKLFPCTECSKSFICPALLNRHLKTHLGTKDFQCVYCGRGYYSKESLDRHILTHTCEPEFQCSLCGEQFYERSVITRHITGKHKCVRADVKKHFVKLERQPKTTLM